jgi:hypothetical protein
LGIYAVPDAETLKYSTNLNRVLHIYLVIQRFIYMELNIETMTLSDLTQIKSILEERLLQKEKWMNSERGRNYEEFCRKELIYHNDENHSKLKRVNQRIEDFINVV